MTLPGDKVQVVALALHEIATKAAKYGAISQEGARLAVRWYWEGKGEARGLALEWREGGVAMPEVEARQRGFGAELIERMLPLSAEGADPARVHPGWRALPDHPSGLGGRTAGGRGVSAAGQGALRGRRILVAEDEYFVAEEITEVLGEAGVEVVGPAATVEEARDLAANGQLDGAVLDVNLGGTMIWPVLGLLAARGVPVVLATGYEAAAVPAVYAHLPRCEKPVPARDILSVLAKQVLTVG